VESPKNSRKHGESLKQSTDNVPNKSKDAADVQSVKKDGESLKKSTNNVPNKAKDAADIQSTRKHNNGLKKSIDNVPNITKDAADIQSIKKQENSGAIQDIKGNNQKARKNSSVGAKNRGTERPKGRIETVNSISGWIAKVERTRKEDDKKYRARTEHERKKDATKEAATKEGARKGRTREETTRKETLKDDGPNSQITTAGLAEEKITKRDNTKQESVEPKTRERVGTAKRETVNEDIPSNEQEKGVRKNNAKEESVKPKSYETIGTAKQESMKEEVPSNQNAAEEVAEEKSSQKDTMEEESHKPETRKRLTNEQANVPNGTVERAKTEGARAASAPWEKDAYDKIRAKMQILNFEIYNHEASMLKLPGRNLDHKVHSCMFSNDPKGLKETLVSTLNLMTLVTEIALSLTIC